MHCRPPLSQTSLPSTRRCNVSCVMWLMLMWLCVAGASSPFLLALGEALEPKKHRDGFLGPVFH